MAGEAQWQRRLAVVQQHVAQPLGASGAGQPAQVLLVQPCSMAAHAAATVESHAAAAVRSLGDAKSSLGDAKSSLGDTESSLGDA
jgi:hypothetical protein